MMYPTHIAGGIIVGGIVYMVAPAGGPLTFMAGAVVGSLLPDLDHPNAFLNKRAKHTNILAGFGHRTFTHSLLFAFIVLGMFLAGGVWKSLCMGLFYGILSHLLLDMLNPTGIPLFWPYTRRFNISRIKTGSGGDYLILITFIAIFYLFFKTKQLL